MVKNTDKIVVSLFPHFILSCLLVHQYISSVSAIPHVRGKKKENQYLQGLHDDVVLNVKTKQIETH